MCKWGEGGYLRGVWRMGGLGMEYLREGEAGESGFVVSHPWRKCTDAARMGHSAPSHLASQ